MSNLYTVLVVHPNPTCFAMQSKAMIWKEPRQLHQRKARPIRLRKRNLSLNVLVQSAANACHRVFLYTLEAQSYTSQVLLTFKKTVQHSHLDRWKMGWTLADELVDHWSSNILISYIALYILLQPQSSVAVRRWCHCLE